MTDPWRAHPAIELPTPVLALLARRGEVLAGGWGGIAGYTPDEGWVPRLTGLSLRSVMVLAESEGTLLAGGDGGVARSIDGGQSWRRCLVPEGTGPVTALALSPYFSEDGVALAGTLASGALRTTDGGRSWQISSFGLGSADVLALDWITDESVIAATDAGLFQSPNGGRAWRVLPRTAGRAFVAVSNAEGGTLAAPEAGPPLRSADGLATWIPLGSLPDDIQISALLRIADSRILLGSADHGLLLSTDDGVSWPRVSTEGTLGFSINESRVYAATDTGVLESRDGGETWTELPPPPLHDLRRLHIVDGAPLISGTNSAPVILGANEAWTTLPRTPSPLLGLFAAQIGALFCSSPNGLFVSRDSGASWTSVITGEEGRVTQMTCGPGGLGWAGITADGALLRTRDGGLTWERLPSPFGILPLVALQAVPGSTNRSSNSLALIAVTYDERQQTAVVWRSEDGAERWSRGAPVRTPWPMVPTCGSPPAVAVGNAITVQQLDGEWRQGVVSDIGLRRIAGEGSLIFALGVDTLWRSDDFGLSWRRDDSGVPIEQTLDIAFDTGILYALLTAGRLWSRRL